MFGYTHIYCGNGKGKTTAALGLALRAAGSGGRVLIYQFLKDNSSSEIAALRALPNITRIDGPGRVLFSFQMNDDEKRDLAQSNAAIFETLRAMQDDFDLLVLDEAIYAVDIGLLDEQLLLTFLDGKPAHLEVVLTGQNPSEELCARADYITEMCKRKHPFDEGLQARTGIEK